MSKNIHHELPAISTLERKQYPVKILQFGSGNFLRAFIDWMVQEANDKLDFNAGVSIVQSVSRDKKLEEQQGLYTVLVKGLHKGQYLQQQYRIDCVQRIVQPQDNFSAFLDEAINTDLQFIVSNTTEAGIVFNEQDKQLDTLALTFPGKLTQLLYHRFKSKLTGRIVVLPCELIEKNGEVLKRCVETYAKHWQLPADFIEWINTEIVFCNTLVDRIVPGAPKTAHEAIWKALGYKDELMVMAEWFHLLAIEAPDWVKEALPWDKAGINVIFTKDLDLYRNRKVKILNGAHSAMACVGFLAGIPTVREAMEHKEVSDYIRKLVYKEIIPVLAGDKKELEAYAEEVFARFMNPSIEHALLSITLNSFGKFKVRLLPTLLAHTTANGYIPSRLAYAFAALFFFYRGLKSGKEIQINDDPMIVEAVKEAWRKASFNPEGIQALCATLLARADWWGSDLSSIPHLAEQTGKYLYAIDQHGIVESLRELNRQDI
ncbi:MAG: tagaturonate reductase [Cytophagia bacterium]|nr:tagaturonate reductase [Cytophagia bacterium]